jgi:uncharacterized protein YbbC (DUF1343 family)
VTDDRCFQPYRTSVALLAAVKARWPDALHWKSPPYEYEREKMPIDCIAGGDLLRQAIDAGELAGGRIATRLDELCDGRAERWRAATSAVRLYGD